MNMIVRMYLPSQEHALSETSCNFTAELIALAKQPSHFKPLGSAFMSPFLHTIWAAGNHDTRMALTSTLHLYQIDFDPRNAKFLSERINTLFHNMRSRLAAQSLRNISSSATPPLPDPPSESIGTPAEIRANHPGSLHGQLPLLRQEGPSHRPRLRLQVIVPTSGATRQQTEMVPFFLSSVQFV